MKSINIYNLDSYSENILKEPNIFGYMMVTEWSELLLIVYANINAPVFS